MKSAMLRTVAMSLFIATPIAAQTTKIPAGSTAAEVQQAAEREGSTYRRVASRDASPRTCALPWNEGPAKSGEFTIGGTLTGVVAMHAGKRGKISWSPLYASKDMAPLIVRGRNLTTLTDTVIVESKDIGWPTNPGHVTAEADRKYFFPTGITLPTPGRWLLVATTGANWGCVILTVV